MFPGRGKGSSFCFPPGTHRRRIGETNVKRVLSHRRQTVVWQSRRGHVPTAPDPLPTHSKSENILGCAPEGYDRPPVPAHRAVPTGPPPSAPSSASIYDNRLRPRSTRGQQTFSPRQKNGHASCRARTLPFFSVPRKNPDNSPSGSRGCPSRNIPGRYG